MEGEGKEAVSKCTSENSSSVPVRDSSRASKLNKSSLVTVGAAFYTRVKLRLKTEVAKLASLVTEREFLRFYVSALTECHLSATESKPKGFLPPVSYTQSRASVPIA